jgi:ankyrin repeat protein
MNFTSKWKLHLFYLVLLLVLVPIVLYAGQSKSSDYVVRFDRQMQQLTIAESSFMPVLDIQNSRKRVSEFRVNPNTLTKAGGTDIQPLILPSGKKNYKCQLGKALYQVVVKPYIFNARVMGECGAADSIISLSVSRNGKQIFSNLNFETSCHSDRTIHRIQITEPSKSIKILALLDPEIRVERTFTLSSFPKEWGKAIFEDLPTGDINADLFMAVYRRDISAIRQAIQRGADPNATNVNGFPPLTLLNIGRPAAYYNRTLTEYDHLSEEIAKALFAAGVSGKATNIHGVTMLEYLIGKVPNTVIDMMLACGADAREGYPLKIAVGLGDTKLAEKLINEGAVPNQIGPDRTTALYTASTSGFYTRSGHDTPPITEYVKCIRLLLQNGANVRYAVSGEEGLLWYLVRSFGKDERLKIILAELIPHADRDGIDRAQKLADKIAKEKENDAYASLAQWLREYIH